MPELPKLAFREVIVAPYRFFYRAKGDTVWVVATRHGAQVVLVTPNPMRWSDPFHSEIFEKEPGLLDTPGERGINGLLDLYAQDARAVAREEATPLVDVQRAFEDFGARPANRSTTCSWRATASTLAPVAGGRCVGS